MKSTEEKFKITPLQDRVLVLQDEPEKQLGNIYIPPTIQEQNKPQKGTVISCGPGLPNEPLTVKPNDRILFQKNAGATVEENGKKYLMMKESEIMAIIK